MTIGDLLREEYHGWVGFDLDGTLAHYDGWKGPEHIGEPVPAMLDLVKRLLFAGREVRIVTARVGVQPNGEDVIAKNAIERWCFKHVGMTLPVTASKDFKMLALFDDRAFSVESNTGKVKGEPLWRPDFEDALAAVRAWAKYIKSPWRGTTSMLLVAMDLHKETNGVSFGRKLKRAVDAARPDWIVRKAVHKQNVYVVTNPSHV